MFSSLGISLISGLCLRTFCDVPSYGPRFGGTRLASTFLGRTRTDLSVSLRSAPNFLFPMEIASSWSSYGYRLTFLGSSACCFPVGVCIVRSCYLSFVVTKMGRRSLPHFSSESPLVYYFGSCLAVIHPCTWSFPLAYLDDRPYIGMPQSNGLAFFR